MSKPLSKDPDLPVIILSALRYAMGRNTYITSLTADFIKRHWHRIPYKHQYNIHRDLPHQHDRPPLLAKPPQLHRIPKQ